jgi:hypothetical protein
MSVIMPYGDNAFPLQRYPNGVGYADIASAMSDFFFL